jgi:heterodisulfide reductase subunit C
MTCSSRCPQEFDLAKFMDAVRETALEKGVEIKNKDIIKFHEAFLNQIKHFGRAYEVGLVAEYKLKTMHLFDDVDSSPGMLLKGKLKVLPHNIKDKESVRKIFKKTAKK